MKVFRKVSFVVIFAILSIIGGIYIYAFVDRLSLDEQRKNITIYDTNGNVMYESNFKKDMQWTPI
ncbi:MAG: penicillin-binding protein, partial [Longicatena sp.]